MSDSRYTYKLLVNVGMAMIPMEIDADNVVLTDKGAYCFQRKKKNVAYYPITTTIISDIIDNPDYEAPPEPDGQIDIRALMARMHNQR